MVSGVVASTGGVVETCAEGEIPGVGVSPCGGVQEVNRIRIVERMNNFRSTDCSRERMQVFYLKSLPSERQERENIRTPERGVLIEEEN
jgi:hypothetical protein